MDLTEWLDTPGRVTAMAKHFGFSHSAVSQWKTNGVPLRHMRAVSDFTSGEVGLDSLVAAAIAAASGRANEKGAEGAPPVPAEAEPAKAAA